MRGYMKWVAGTLAVAFFALFGFASESQALTGTLALNAGSFNTFTFVGSTTTPSIHNDVAATMVATTSVLGKNSVLVGFSVYSGTAGGTAAIWDALNIATIADSQTSRAVLLVDEIGEATQYDTVYSDWVAPKKLQNGFALSTINAPTVKVYYQ